MQKRNRKYTPVSIVNRPHYRVELETKRNINTGLSQHELLYNLNQNPGAMVYYACPMVFDRSAIYDIDVDLDALSLADLDLPRWSLQNRPYMITSKPANEIVVRD